MESWRDELYHHGVLGQRWGVRRYQNPDGTYTDAGRRRYRAKSIAKTLSTIGDAKKSKETGFSDIAAFRYANEDAKRSTPVKRFNENSKEYESLQVHKRIFDTIKEATNIKVNKEMAARLGKFGDLVRDNKAKEVAEYLDQGTKLYRQYMSDPNARSIREKYMQASRDYERAATSFSKDFFGKYGDLPVSGTVAVDAGSDAAREMAVYEVYATEMLRNAGGVI